MPLTKIQEDNYKHCLLTGHKPSFEDPWKCKYCGLIIKDVDEIEQDSSTDDIRTK